MKPIVSLVRSVVICPGKNAVLMSAIIKLDEPQSVKLICGCFEQSLSVTSSYTVDDAELTLSTALEDTSAYSLRRRQLRRSWRRLSVDVLTEVNSIAPNLHWQFYNALVAAYDHLPQLGPSDQLVLPAIWNMKF